VCEPWGIREKPIARGSPWQNCFAERLIGSIRRECLDHIVVVGEAHLRRILDAYAAYYNVSRTHRSPGKDAPFSLADERAARRDWRGHFSAHAFAATASSLSPVASLAAMAARYLRAREAAGPNRGVPSGARIARVAIGAAGAVVDRFAHIANARNERDVDTIFEVLKRRGVGALLIIGERHHSTYR